MATLCANARSLIDELTRSSWLPPYNRDGVEAVKREIHALNEEIQDLVECNKENVRVPKEIEAALTIYEESMYRNKRCALAYVWHRIEKICELRWQAGPIIPPELSVNLCDVEYEYFSRYDRILADYQQHYGIDLTTDLEPPHELYMEVRSLVSDVEVFIDGGSLKLSKGALYYLRKSDVCNLLKQGIVDEVSFKNLS